MAKTISGARHSIAFLALGLLVAPAALGADWAVRPSVLSSVTYSDNVFLEPVRQEDATLEIKPTLQLQREGQKWNLLANYSLQSLTYADRSELDQVFNFLDMESDAVFVEDTLGASASANISQQIIDPEAGGGFSTFAGASNLNEVISSEVEPYYLFRLGKFTRGRIAYRAGILEYAAPELRDSKNRRATATVGSQRESSRINWSLSASDAQIDYDSGAEIGLRRASIDLAYRVSPLAEFVVTYGEDNNDFGFNPLTDTDGGFWFAGLRGKLGASSSYEIRAGEQFFGDSIIFKFEREKRRLSTAISYTEQATTISAQQFEFENLLSQLNEVGGFELPTGEADAYVQKSFTFRGGYKLTKSTFSLAIFDERREFINPLALQDRSRTTGTRADWTWKATPETRYTAGVSWREFEVRNSNVEPQDFSVSLSLRRTLSGSAYLTGRLRHQRRGNTRSTDEYKSNAISVGVGYEF